MERSLRHLSHRLRRKIPKLTSIATTAPMLGTLFVLAGFTDAFRHIGDLNYFCECGLTESLSEPFVPMVLALIAATFGTGHGPI